MSCFEISDFETVESLITKINSSMDDLNPTEQKAAKSFIKRPYELLTKSVQDIAKESLVSQASWVRFAQRIGFAGLKEFKQFLSQDLLNKSLKKEMEVPYAEIKGDGDLSSLVERVYSNNIKAIESTRNILNVEILEKVVNEIVKCRNLHLFGVGASGIVAQDAQYKFARIGLNAIHFKDLHMQLTTAATMSSQDLAIFISNSGTTKDVLDIAHAVKNSGAKIVAITKFSFSELSEMSDYVLNNVPEDQSRRAGAMASRISQLTVVDLIYTLLANKLQDEIEDYLDKSHSYLVDNSHI